jgi:hypothetical protein
MFDSLSQILVYLEDVRLKKQHAIGPKEEQGKEESNAPFFLLFLLHFLGFLPFFELLVFISFRVIGTLN